MALRPPPPALPSLPDPAASRVPFADSGAALRYWPVLTRDPHGREVAYRDVHGEHHGAPARSFLANRDKGARHHVAIDLWGDPGDVVVAAEGGEIVHFYPFYDGVFALIVQCDSGLVLNYGELAGSSLADLGLKKNDRVSAGQPIGTVGRSTDGSHMCHFETYVTGTVGNQRWMAGQPVPHALLDPTAYVIELARSGR